MSLARQMAEAARRRIARWAGGPAKRKGSRRRGMQFTPPPSSITRWYVRDVESAIRMADGGDLSRAAQLAKSMRRDGVLSGVLSTRTGGLVRLPKRFTGRPDMVAQLEGRHGRRTLFDRMFPAAELEKLAADGVLLGVGVGEMVDVEGRREPVLRRLDPQWLRYYWGEDRWYYLSTSGPIPITPGDGRWILHLPGGVDQPWSFGLWPALARSYISKEHAFLHRENFGGKLANPARAAVAPSGSSEEQRRGFLDRLIAWGVNTTFELPPGWDVKLIESNGRGYEVFADMIQTANEEMIIAIAGQLVTVSGGTGFSNADIHATVRSDLIQQTGEGLAHTVNEQGLVPWTNRRFGAGAVAESVEMEWDIKPPKDLKAEAETLSAASKAIEDANRALRPYKKSVDDVEIATRFSIPIRGDVDSDAIPDVELEPVSAPEVPEEAPEAPPKTLAIAACAPEPPPPQRCLAYAFRPGKPPTELQLWTAEDNPTDYGVHRWTSRSAKSVMDIYEQRGNPLPIDIEHNCSDHEKKKRKTDEPPETGGYAELQLRNGEPWLVFDWSAPAVEMIRTRQRLFLSPEYLVDKETGEIVALVRVSLVSNPGTHHARMLASAPAPASTKAVRSNMDIAMFLAALEAALTAEDPKSQIQALIDKVKEAGGAGPADDVAAMEGDDDDDEPPVVATAPAPKMPPVPSAAKAASGSPQEPDTTAIHAAADDAIARIKAERDAFARDQLLTTEGHRLSEPVLAWAKGQPLGIVEGLLKATPKAEAKRAAAATRGEGSGDEPVSKLPPNEAKKLNQLMGITAKRLGGPSVNQGRFSLSAMRPKDFLEQRLAAQKGA